MSTTIYGIVTALELSPKFVNFKRKHLSVTNREIVSWNSKTDNDFELNILHSFENSTEVANDTVISPVISDTVMQALDLILTKSKLGTLSIDINTTKNEFENGFPGFNFEFDEMLQDTNNNVWPNTMTINNSNVTVITYFYPAKFEVNYPNSNVSVIPLIDEVDDYGSVNLATVNRLIGELGTLPFAEQFRDVTEELPCTALEIAEHKWVNKSNLTETVEVPFGLVCYGYPSEDVKEAAIRNFINNNSELSKTDKEVIFPTLFGSYGFNLFPFWDKIALSQIRDIYSPLVRTDDMLDFVANNIIGLNGTHVTETWELLPTVFQSLTCLSIPDADDRYQLTSLKDYIGSYFLVAPTHADFTQMDPVVQEFTRSLMEALSIAEDYPETAPVNGIELETVGEMTYSTFFSSGLRWRILTKRSYLETKANSIN